MTEDQEEMKCPVCGGDMKEFITSFKCRRNGNDGYCNYEFRKYFQIENTSTQPRASGSYTFGSKQ